MMQLRQLSSLIRAKRGNAAIIGALALPIIVGAAGLGIDTIQWTLTQRKLQRAADSAALAGAFAKTQGKSATSSANASLTRDNYVAMSATPQIQATPTSGPYSGNPSAVRVILSDRHALPFSSIFLRQAPLIRVESTAAAVSNGTYCVITLETANTTGITMQGNATVNLGCGLSTNSPAATAVSAGGSSLITASPVAAVGGIPDSSNYATGTVLLRHSLPQSDPFASLPTPNPNGCGAALATAPNSTVNVSNPSGTKCYRGMDIKGTVNFAPGIYYIDGSTGSSMKFGSQAVVNGTGVTFILTSTSAASTPSSIAQVDMNGGAQIHLSAPTSGTYAGVLFYQDRRALNYSGNKINGTSNSFLQGAMYFPSQELQFSGDSGMNTQCIQIVSRRVTFIGNTVVENECDDTGAHSFFGTRVLLVS